MKKKDQNASTLEDKLTRQDLVGLVKSKLATYEEYMRYANCFDEARACLSTIKEFLALLVKTTNRLEREHYESCKTISLSVPRRAKRAFPIGRRNASKAQK